MNDISHNPVSGFEDWEVIESSHEGIQAECFCEDNFIELPDHLKVAADNLKEIVPDEEENLSSRFFNGARYALVKYENNLKGIDEKNKCRLYFKKSDYRSFLVTNGLNNTWAKLAGLEDKSRSEWLSYWKQKGYDVDSFFFNSFGIYILITVSNPEGGKYAIFRRRSENVAINKNMIVATVDEGLRRRSKNKFFDESSEGDQSPDIFKAAHRALLEETGLDINLFPKHILKLLAAGMIKSELHYGALFHLDLNISLQQFRHGCEISSDSRLEFSDLLTVRFERDHLMHFLNDRQKNSSLASYLFPLILYSLGPNAVKMKKIFLSHNSKDKVFVRKLAKVLVQAGFSVWIDEAEIKFGESLVHKISDAIFSEIDCLMAIISQDSIKSEWVKSELDWAKNHEINKKIFIIPVKIDDCEIPNSLKGKLYADLSTGLKNRVVVKKIIESIRIL